MIRKAALIFIIFFPWFIKRRLYSWCFGFQLHPTSKIGFSYIDIQCLSMSEGAVIKHLTSIKGVKSVTMELHSRIGNLNWISAPDKKGALILKQHSAITNRHYIDCTSQINIGKFTTVAGVKSTLLTHSIDIYESRQSSNPIVIGDYCFIGTGVIVLGGAAVPNKSIVGAGALVTKPLDIENSLYGGAPAKFIKHLPTDLAYFQRSVGVVK